MSSEYLENDDAQPVSDDIAIIAMVCRFPDANDIDSFWHNLKNGVESVRSLSNDTISGGGLDQFVAENPSFVYAEATLDRDLLKGFDAPFFGMSPKEARIMDPQHRLFLESCWELFEASGYCTEHYDGRVGVFGSAGYSGYIENFSMELMQQVGIFQTQLANDKDFLATRVAYKMGFTGPAINVNTLCSSSAVGVHLAREALLNFQIDYAIAGGVNISVADKGTSYYHEGGIGADEGHCRAYDENASGTVAGNGLGIIALKRLDDALADGDYIHGVLKGTAVNNDGSEKASYTAPSPEGQAECIAEALSIADVDPRTIEFIDGHGTGTYIGDPIEIAALTKAYRQHTDDKQFCGIGSVKTNIGHLVTAGGMASLIKAVLALEHQQMPPSLNFERENSKIDFANSPFYVNHSLKDWPQAGHPRRAAISSFGIGGTNVHMIFEQAPESEPLPSNDGFSPELVVLSAKTDTALSAMKQNLLAHIEQHPDINLADLAYTLKVGRMAFEHKFIAVCHDLNELKAALSGGENARHHIQKRTERPVCFTFSGQGSQYPQMAQQLYQQNEQFSATLDECFALLAGHNIELKSVLFGSAEQQLTDTKYAQLALFVVEYALQKLWHSFGIVPDCMIGHSIGEYVAACVSGVFSLEDALYIVARRGELMAKQPAGAMLSVALSEQQLSELMPQNLDLAAVNGPNACVVAGSSEAIESFAHTLEQQGIGKTLLKTSHAFHSRMMEGALSEFAEAFAAVELGAPQIEFISNVTGDWITPEQAGDVNYWVSQLRSPVRFFDGVTKVAERGALLIEVGPGKSLTTLAQRAGVDKALLTHSLPGVDAQGQDMRQLQQAIGECWLAGVMPNWRDMYQQQSRKRLRLPTYAFDRTPHWVDRNFSRGEAVSFDASVDTLEQIQQVIGSQEQFSTGRLSIDVEFSTDPAIAQRQLLAIAQLKQQLEDTCNDIASDNHIGLKVSPLGLKKVAGSEELNISAEQLKPRPELETEYQGPRSELEGILCEIWQLSLGQQQVGIFDDFYDLGGDSLIASVLVNQLRQRHGIDVGLRELLAVPTVASLAQMLENRSWLEQQDDDSDSASAETLVL